MDWEDGPLSTDSAPSSHRRRFLPEHLAGLVDRRSCPRRCRSRSARASAASTFQPAALYAARRASIATPATQGDIPDALEAVTTTLARAWCAPRTCPTSSPIGIGIAGMLSNTAGGELKAEFRRRRRPHRQRSSAAQVKHPSGTADRGGLDTMAHVIKTLQDNPQPRHRPLLWQLWHPAGAGQVIEPGNLGQKTKAGLPRSCSPRRAALRSGQRRPCVSAGECLTRCTSACSRSRRAPEAAAQRRRPLPLGHSAQQLPLRCGAPGHRPHCA